MLCLKHCKLFQSLPFLRQTSTALLLHLKLLKLAPLLTRYLNFHLKPFKLLHLFPLLSSISPLKPVPFLLLTLDKLGLLKPRMPLPDLLRNREVRIGIRRATAAIHAVVVVPLPIKEAMWRPIEGLDNAELVAEVGAGLARV